MFDSFEGPEGAFGLSANEVIGHCGAGQPWLVHYDVDRDPTLKRDFYDSPALQATVFSANSGTQRNVLEIAYLGGAQDPRNTVKKREHSGAICDEPANDIPPLEAITGHLSYMQRDGLHAVGGHLEWAVSFGRRGLSLGPRFGLRQYRGDDKRFYRFEVGGRAAVGFEVLNLALLIEKGRRLRDDGSVASDTFVYGGVELSLSRYWVTDRAKRLYRKLIRSDEMSEPQTFVAPAKQSKAPLK